MPYHSPATFFQRNHSSAPFQITLIEQLEMPPPSDIPLNFIKT